MKSEKKNINLKKIAKVKKTIKRMRIKSNKKKNWRIKL